MSQNNLRKRAAPELELDNSKKAHLDEQVEAPFTKPDALEEFVKNLYAKIERESANGANGPVLQSLKETAEELEAVVQDTKNRNNYLISTWKTLNKGRNEQRIAIDKIKNSNVNLTEDCKEIEVSIKHNTEIATDKGRLIEAMEHEHDALKQRREQLDGEIDAAKIKKEIEMERVEHVKLLGDRQWSLYLELLTFGLRRLTIPPWKKCEKCDKTYSDNLTATPRVLDCGHTFCYTCATKFIDEFNSECPLDNKKIKALNAAMLPINRLALLG